MKRLLNQHSCYFFDKRGNIDQITDETNNLNYNHYHLKCLLMGAINYYGYNANIGPIYVIDKNVLWERVYIHLLMQAQKVKYVVFMDRGEPYNLFFLPRNLTYIKLRAYIKEKVSGNVDTSVYKYIILRIEGYPEEYIRGRFIRDYIKKNGNGKFMEYFRMIDSAQDIGEYQKYNYKYDYVEKTDGFKEFDAGLDRIRAEAGRVVRGLVRGFDKYDFPYPVQEYIFRTSIVADITPDLLVQIKDAEKKLGIKVVYDHK
jgi:hypothetical protein